MRCPTSAVYLLRSKMKAEDANTMSGRGGRSDFSFSGGVGKRLIYCT
jgi:hypothetical protein